ncbi:DinB family protein [uncultured Microscilla sp.]|uniref:DinB family protein n=1 Tax=uncultured Microscilla sp. TaxID=432653 RepID=UPI0026101A96|nr:DinB family protein [uncultured Microscilla sp.]
MKQINTLFLALFCCLSIQLQAQTEQASVVTNMSHKGTINTNEKAFLQNFLNVTETDLIKTILSIDKAIWNKQTNKDTWSMGQCMTHIIQAEKAILGQIKKTLKAPADNSTNLRHKDAWLISKIADRGRKVKTPLNNAPKALTQEESIAQLKQSRKTIKAFLANEDLPLRNHFGRSPYGKADAYQLFLVIVTHSMRHHAQMMEVMADLKK